MQFLVIILLTTLTDCKKTKQRRGSVDSYNKHDVDFGHIYRDPEKNRRLFEGGDKLNLEDAYAMRDNSRDIAGKYMPPRDKMLYEKMRKAEEVEVMRNNSGNPMYYNFEAILDRNLARSYPEPLVKTIPRPDTPFTSKPQNINVDELEERTYMIKETTSNWTTCEEFAKKALFHPDDIVNLEWIPFYIWSLSNVKIADIHRFTYPTKKLVQKFKSDYGPHLTGIEWNQPKLLLNDTREILLIAKDRRGLFEGIVKSDLPESIKGTNTTLPILSVRIKILDPFLALMYCDDKTTYMMAILGEEPQSDPEKIKAASILNFRGKGTPVSSRGHDTSAISDLFKEKFLDVERQIEKSKSLKPPRFDLSRL
ncbi:unnamed protein product [Pieris brassicae]|uniref:Fam-a protein n=2 Tax=Pieris brassicae TaxID=7116 RepID=A0A9P0TAT6_PIEBR|nr:unnamed protein product [Pieris brassicae]